MQGGSDDQEIMKQNQDRRSKPTMQGDQDQPQQPQQPQKCPRCESLNTKFCYYNNYSLSQPRYFCKTCRRYWTLGGTLRNVPVGGGCRKGKRARTTSTSATMSSSSGENSNRPRQSLAAAPPPQSIISGANSGSLVSPAVQIPPYYPSGGGGGFVTSLAAMHQPPQGFGHQPPYHRQPMNLGGGGGLNGSSSHLGLLHGFTSVNPSFASQQQRQLYQVVGDGDDNKNSMEHPFHPDHEGNLIHQPRSRPISSSQQQQQQQSWHQQQQQGFIANSNNPTITDTSLWSICTSTTAGNTNSNNAPSGSTSSLNPDHQWHDLPGYGPPP
ncbi:hypothetical protein Tsubulata_028323 [Turnera subulata]|uniref:Dof zinc finger protein n=1 Tax=Turnera subulata TaxID=218843 RepID=A0A9Q0JAG8_9ROSI|nr:hypothetical protein Tsubulata_028323 [Turnera subulata]